MTTLIWILILSFLIGLGMGMLAWKSFAKFMVE